MCGRGLLASVRLVGAETLRRSGLIPLSKLCWRLGKLLSDVDERIEAVYGRGRRRSDERVPAQVAADPCEKDEGRRGDVPVSRCPFELEGVGPKAAVDAWDGLLTVEIEADEALRAREDGLRSDALRCGMCGGRVKDATLTSRLLCFCKGRCCWGGVIPGR